jgi:predicted transcriptional regulator
MPPRRDDVTEAELAVLEVLWDQGPTPVRAILDRLYPGGGASAFATITKLLERLEAKGFARRDRSGPVQTFAAAIDRDQLIERRLQAVAEQLCGGSLGALASRLVGGRGLSSEERRDLRAFLDHLESSPDPDPGKRRRR